jgi:hypothetical protein
VANTMTDVTFESVTKELFLMNWQVLEENRNRSYAQRLNARLRGNDPLLADMLALVSQIRATGSEFTNLYEENRQNVAAVLTKVAITCRDYSGWTVTTENEYPPFLIGLGPSTLVKLRVSR